MVALGISAGSIAVAVVAAWFSYLQWTAANQLPNIAYQSLKLAEKSAKDQAADIERSRKAAEESARAAYSIAATREKALLSAGRHFQATLEQSQRALDASIDAFRTDQRAWVGGTFVTLPECAEGSRGVFVAVGCRGRLGVDIENVGPTTTC